MGEMEQHHRFLVGLSLTQVAAEAATTVAFQGVKGLEALEEVEQVIRMVLAPPGQQILAVAVVEAGILVAPAAQAALAL